MNIAPRVAGKPQLNQGKGRQDPAPRPVRGTTEKYSKVRNGDPERRYLLQYMADTDGFSARVREGYEVERYREGGPMIGPQLFINSATQEVRSYKVGDIITDRGHVLLSIPKDVWNEIQTKGSESGGLGSEYYDALEERMVDKTGLHDPLRGAGKFMRMVNEIGPTEVELDV